MADCFFCDVKNINPKQIIAENQFFMARFDDFPVSLGHLEIFPRDHIESFFDLTEEQIVSFYQLISEAKKIIDNKYHPDGYNIGVNEGEAAGRSQHHLHIHLIGRYKGDVKNPRGGIRNVIPAKTDYYHEAKKDPSLEKYL